jgi:uncharacterized protein YjbI with pentapeptide repeats
MRDLAVEQIRAKEQASRLRAALRAWANGTDRTEEAAERIRRLLGPELEWIPFFDELQYATTRFLPEDPDGEALAGLAREVLAGLESPTPRPPRWRLGLTPELRRLQKRWLEPEGVALARRILEALSRGQSLQPFGLGEHEGRVDLRGFANPGGPDEMIRLQGSSGRLGSTTVRLHGLDLSGSDLGSVAVSHADVRDCRFDGARFVGKEWAGSLGISSSEVADTSFRGSDLTELHVFRWRGEPDPILRRVDFTGARLTRAGFEGRVEDCDFSGASLKHTQFHCHLVGCRFAGYLDEPEFYGRLGGETLGLLDGVDFSDAEFHFVSIRDLDLERVRFPTGPGHLVIENWPCVLRHMKAAFDVVPADDPFRHLGWVVDLDLKSLGRDQQVGLLVLADIRHGATDPQVDRFLALLAEARAACAAERSSGQA